MWIHGGGFYQGSGADERYNMSEIVENSYKIGKDLALSLDTWEPDLTIILRQTVHRCHSELQTVSVGLYKL